jgi:hypothetical protein
MRTPLPCGLHCGMGREICGLGAGVDLLNFMAVDVGSSEAGAPSRSSRSKGDRPKLKFGDKVNFSRWESDAALCFRSFMARGHGLGGGDMASKAKEREDGKILGAPGAARSRLTSRARTQPGFIQMHWGE